MSDELLLKVEAWAAARKREAETTGDRWGDPISEVRQAELQGYLDRWQAETDHGERKGPFDRAGLSDEEWERFKLTGADVFWLAEQRRRDQFHDAPNLHLEGADLSEAHLETLYVNTPNRGSLADLPGSRFALR